MTESPLPTTDSTPHSATDVPRWARLLVGAVAVLATLGVFALYQHPDFLLTLADQLWACF